MAGQWVADSDNSRVATDITEHNLCLAVGLALFSAMMFAATFGAFAPLLLNRCKFDPAVASGPFVTASNDIIALLIYYGIIVLMLPAGA